MSTSTPNFARIAAALDLSATAGEADILEAIDKLRPPGDDLIRAVLDGEIEGISYNAEDDTVTHELADPLVFGTQEIAELHYRRAKTKDLRLAARTPPTKRGEGAADGGVDVSVRLWARLSGQAASALDDTCPEDIATFGRILPFLQEPRRKISAALARG